MNTEIEKKEYGAALLDGVLRLAFEEEDVFAGEEMPVPSALESRMRRRIRIHSAVSALRCHARGIAAVFVCVLALGIVLALSGRASADVPLHSWTLTSETDVYGQNLMVSFVTEKESVPANEKIVPRSVSEVLGDAEKTGSYRTDAAYLEEYAGGVRYEQCLLSAGGVTVIPVRGRTVKNIVIGGRAAVLAFDADSAAILWQDGRCSYLLTGPFTADDAMRTAREMAEDR